MRILCFADTRFPIERANGVQTMNTCHALAARGHDVTLVVRADTAMPARNPFDFYDLRPLETLRIDRTCPPSGATLSRARFLAAALGRVWTSNADVVFTRDLGIASCLLQAPWLPVVYEAHGVAASVAEEMPALLGKPELAPSRRKLRRLERRDARVWRDARAYVTITRSLADELAARFGRRDRVFVIPDGARAVHDVPVVPNVPAPVAGYAGHLYPWKGVDVFLHALSLVPEVRGLVIGGHPADGDLSRIRGLVDTLGLAHRVELVGQVPPGDVRRTLAAATMLVLPNTPSAISERYTSPLKLFEYLGMGRPIVASDLPSLREVLTHEGDALLVTAGDPAAMAGALRRLASDAALAARLASGAARLVPQYTWERRAERLDAAFAAALARPA